MTKISAAIVTWNEELNIERAIKSIKPYVDEVVVVDMSTNPQDQTHKIAKNLGSKVYKHEFTGFVEPARNFSIQKTTGDWVFILDADEELSPGLGKELRNIANNEIVYVEIPRQNIVFGKWLQHSRWWPDYLIRYFKKGSISWPSQIHTQPSPKGVGKKLEPTQDNSIIHHHYESVSQYLTRLNRYTDHQLSTLKSNNYVFKWQDLIRRPTNEFLSRFYYGKGYLDGIHGLALAMLQSFSEFVLYLKAWESHKFEDVTDKSFQAEVETEIRKSILDWRHWEAQTGNLIKKIKFKLRS